MFHVLQSFSNGATSSDRESSKPNQNKQIGKINEYSSVQLNRFGCGVAAACQINEDEIHSFRSIIARKTLETAS